jgi:hypothetical protein
MNARTSWVPDPSAHTSARGPTLDLLSRYGHVVNGLARPAASDGSLLLPWSLTCTVKHGVQPNPQTPRTDLWKDFPPLSPKTWLPQ